MPFTFTMPKLSPTMEEGVIAKWHKKENEFVEAGELLLEVTTDKATVEHNALDEGWLRKILLQEGESARVNQPLAIFTASKEESITNYQIAYPKEETPLPKSQEEKKEEKATVTPLGQPSFVPEPPLKREFQPKHPPGRIIASPLARRLAKEEGLDLASVEGTGPGGRIIAKDLERAQPESLISFRKGDISLPAGSYEEIAMTPMRRVIARRLQEAKTFIPHFYVKKVVDAASLMNLRLQLKELSLKVSVNDLLLRAAALALRKHPEINRGFNSVTQKIIQFQTIDISIAVTLEEGLITPIVRHADQKDITSIAGEVKELAGRARLGKLEESEYKGGSFTLSNLGMYGIDEFSAVINPPQAAILAIGAVKEGVIVQQGVIKPSQLLTLVLSADHRVIDGAQAAQFLMTLTKLIENPVALTL